jgi:hypothetical protein
MTAESPEEELTMAETKRERPGIGDKINVCWDYPKDSPINKVSTANLITSPAEDVLFDKVNEIIDRVNKMNELTR